MYTPVMTSSMLQWQWQQHCVLAKLINEYTRTLLAVRQAMQADGAGSGTMQSCRIKELASRGGKLLRGCSMLRYFML